MHKFRRSHKSTLENRRTLLLFGLWGCSLSSVQGFAYAPNFITKILQDETGIDPFQKTVPTSEETADTAAVTTKQTDDDVVPPRQRRIKTRFPPEPNGYLHLGHAKAISFNFAVARMFDGTCNMRLDDTNPSKEDTEYVESILDDVRWIQSGMRTTETGETRKKTNAETTTTEAAVLSPWEGPVRKTSDYFETIYACAETLITQGDAYVDSLSADEMRVYRGSLTAPGTNSPYRTRTVDENLDLFRAMRRGECAAGDHVLRAKIDMAAPNLNLRDPTLYRIQFAHHQDTGNTWCLYPMYDFSHPIADALEQITHSLCTLEFEDHRPLYEWTIDKLIATPAFQSVSATRPQQIEFSRLNVQNTVLSKRKLIQLVDHEYVTGWDDPRMPTLSGLRRRGVPPSAIRLFCERVGISKTDSNISYAAFEECVRLKMDEQCPRAFAVVQPLKITITNWKSSETTTDPTQLEEFEVPNHPKKSDMGTRSLPFGRDLYIERSDFFDLHGPEGEQTQGRIPKGYKRLLPDQQVRLRYAYVIKCQKIIRDVTTHAPIELQCEYYPETRAGVTPDGMAKVKGIIHWVEATTAVSCTMNQYDRLFLTEEPGKASTDAASKGTEDGGGDYLNDLNPKSLQVLKDVWIEPSVATEALQMLHKIKNDEAATTNQEPVYPSSLAYQFERNGYFALDKESTGGEGSNLVFNRVVTLRDTWIDPNKNKKHKNQNGTGATNGQPQRNRGRGGGGGKQSAAAVVEDIRRVAFRVATIIEVGPHPEADSLLVCQADCGDVLDDDAAKAADDGTRTPQYRTIVAGLAGKIPIDELIGKKIVAVTNLKPAKVRGIESTAMLLAASTDDDEVVELLNVLNDVPNGELLSIEGMEPSQPDPMMKSKGAIKAFDRAKSGLQSNSNGEAVWIDSTTSTASRLMTSSGPVITDTLKDASIR